MLMQALLTKPPAPVTFAKESRAEQLPLLTSDRPIGIFDRNDKTMARRTKKNGTGSNAIKVSYWASKGIFYKRIGKVWICATKKQQKTPP